ncbi:Peptidase M23 [uncultured Caudovirales phage]|uniref:Peptidase M23 n=1 Tax=uncultured Caudovirales phage TaxID=2100421 RepID=A0A6J5QQ26_9CAUD|nr:Peptidase M23 [uncultured Caudovirales phage]CAB4186520.1 Peptidase M23 [uncultured Caudovirales phage]
MPTVPTSFVPQVSSQGDGGIVPLQAPPVEGVRNALPEQQIRFGEAMRSAGNVSFRIGQQLQDSIDEAAAKAADVELSQFSNNILRGKDGYLGLQGKDADTRYEETNSAILSAANGIQSRLKNKTQVELFNQSASRNIVQFQGQMGAHWNDQVPKYLAMESNARAIQSSQDAINSYSFSPDGYVESTAKAEAETAKGLSHLGIYEGSAQYEQSMKKVRSGITAGVVSRLMDENLYQDGLYYLEKQNKSKLIDEPTYQSLRSGLIANRDRQMATELTYNIRATGQLITNAGTGNYLAPVLGGEVVRFGDKETADSKSGLTLKVGSGTQVRSPGRSTVEDYTEGSNKVILRNEDGSQFNFEGIVPLNIKQGNQISRGQIIGTAMDDKKEVGKATLTYSFVKDGVAKNPSSTNVLGPENVKARETNTIQDQLAIADQIPDSEMRGRVRSLLKQEYAQDAALYADAYNQNKFQIYNMDAAGTDIPPAMFAALSPSDQKEFLTKNFEEASKIAKQRAESFSLDAKLAIAEAGGPTQELMNQYAGQMTREDRLTYIKQMETTKSSTASFDQDMFGMLLRQNGLAAYANPKEDHKLKALQMRDAVNAAIEIKKQYTGKDPSDEEKKKIMMGVITDRSYISQWFTDPQVPTSSLTKEERKKAYKNVSGTEIPIDSYDKIIFELTSAGNKSITDGDILSKFNELKSKK